MKSLFSLRSLMLLGVGVLTLSIMLWLVYEAKAQASASTSASASWIRARGAVEVSFNDDPELYPLNKIWRGNGTAKAGRTWGNMTADSGPIYVKIVSQTLSGPSVGGGSASTSYNITRFKNRTQTKMVPFLSKCALARGSFEGNTLRGRIASYPQ